MFRRKRKEEDDEPASGEFDLEDLRANDLDLIFAAPSSEVLYTLELDHYLLVDHLAPAPPRNLNVAFAGAQPLSLSVSLTHHTRARGIHARHPQGDLNAAIRNERDEKWMEKQFNNVNSLAAQGQGQGQGQPRAAASSTTRRGRSMSANEVGAVTRSLRQSAGPQGKSRRNAAPPPKRNAAEVAAQVERERELAVAASKLRHSAAGPMRSQSKDSTAGVARNPAQRNSFLALNGLDKHDQSGYQSARSISRDALEGRPSEREREPPPSSTTGFFFKRKPDAAAPTSTRATQPPPSPVPRTRSPPPPPPPPPAVSPPAPRYPRTSAASPSPPPQVRGAYLVGELAELAEGTFKYSTTLTL